MLFSAHAKAHSPGHKATMAQLNYLVVNFYLFFVIVNVSKMLI